MNKLLTFTLLAFSININAGDLKPFTTDGCSMFPDGDLRDSSKWVKCCIKHDLSYWKGGTKSAREKADDDLQKCVAEAGEKSISKIMHLGVKVGGSPVYPTWYRWGYGWPYNRGYKPLSQKETDQVIKRMTELRKLVDETIEGLK
jgi:hypothetical protein